MRRTFAGAASAFLSAGPLLHAYPIWWLMATQSQNVRDWGIAGNDNVYGNGGASLIDYVPNTLWVARDYGNTSDYPWAPFYTVQAARERASDGWRLVFLGGGDYPEPATLSKEVASEPLYGDLILGE